MDCLCVITVYTTNLQLSPKEQRKGHSLLPLSAIGEQLKSSKGLSISLISTDPLIFVKLNTSQFADLVHEFYRILIEARM